jgi:serine/threonine protein kinase
MGAVYEAHDNVFDTSVALKEVTIDLSNALDTQAQEMTKLAFEREAKILAKISHETIPHVKDYFIEKDAQFLIMELVDGDDLAKLLKQRNAPFPIGTIIEWTDQLLDALDYLHTQEPPIIHRDIKPQNLKQTTRKKIKLLDFGIAKGTESKSANTITNQTFIAATLNYSPIEQMLRVLDPTFLAVITHKYTEQIETILEQNADVRTDLYALGATIYHMATNKQPAEAVKRGIEIWDGKTDPLEIPTQLNPEIPIEFSRFLLKAMQINRVHRYNSAAEMRAALHQLNSVITKPSMSPTVEMSMEDFRLQDTQADFTPTADTSGDTTPIPVPPISQPASAPNTASTAHSAAEVVTEVAKPHSSQQNSQPQTAAQPQTFSSTPQQQPRKKGNKLLWLIPVAGLILVMFVGGALGVWLIYKNLGDPVAGDTNTNTETTETNSDPANDSEVNNETPGNTDITLDTNTNVNDIEPQPDSTETTTVKTPQTQTTNPTPRPTIKATPRPTQISKPPTPRPTRSRTPERKPTPKNMDCIFTDTCD